jgi:hypothetical protein
MLAQWRLVNGHHLLHARIVVTNIGASVVTLRQKGTGLEISLISLRQPTPPSNAGWSGVRVFKILEHHPWIEPGESVSDDLLLGFDVTEPLTSLFEARLSWNWSENKNKFWLKDKKGTGIVVMARQVMPPDSVFDDTLSLSGGVKIGDSNVDEKQG